MATKTVVNTAAVLEAKHAPLVIRERPIGEPGEGEVLVRNYAIAVNPVDWKIQTHGIFVENFPSVLGTDIAGEVVSVGPGVTRFKTGDRVFGFAGAFFNGRNEAGAYQRYTVLNEIGASKLPQNISFEQGAVLPMGMATAAISLFANLGLPLEPRPSDDKTAFVVWGGASSVGISAIQLAHALGWPVYATASPKNHDWIKKLGATEVWDYRDTEAPGKIAAAVKSAGLKLRGALDSVSEGTSFDGVTATLKAAETTPNAKIVTVLPWPQDKPHPEGIELHHAQCVRFLQDRKDVGQWLFGKFLGEGLERGTIKPAPEPQIVGGIEDTQKAFDLLKAGVSGRKLVVEAK